MGGVAWTEEEDQLLKKCVQQYGEGKWHRVPLLAGLKRCRKSCRLRWLNYLRPNIKRGSFTDEEIEMIVKLHKLLGNRWSLIAGRLPGRTANDVKNYWNCHLSKKLNAQEKAAERELMKPQPIGSIITSTSASAAKQRSQEETCPTLSQPAAAAAGQEQEGIMGFEFEQVQVMSNQEDWDDLFLELDLYINDAS